MLQYVQPTNNKDDTISQNATKGLIAQRGKKVISQEANQSINKIRRLLEDYARCSNVNRYKNLFFTPLTRQLCSHFIFKAHAHNNNQGKVPGSQIYIYALQSATCAVWQTRHAEKEK